MKRDIKEQSQNNVLTARGHESTFLRESLWSHSQTNSRVFLALTPQSLCK